IKHSLRSSPTSPGWPPSSARAAATCGRQATTCAGSLSWRQRRCTRSAPSGPTRTPTMASGCWSTIFAASTTATSPTTSGSPRGPALAPQHPCLTRESAGFAYWLAGPVSMRVLSWYLVFSRYPAAVHVVADTQDTLPSQLTDVLWLGLGTTDQAGSSQDFTSVLLGA